MKLLVVFFITGLLLSSCSTTQKPKSLKKQPGELFQELKREEKPTTPQKTEMKQLETDLEKKQKVSDVVEDFTLRKKESGIVDFEETGEGFASKYERTIDAEKRAEEDALSKALKKTGTDIYYGFSDTLAQYGKTQYQFVARYLYTWSSGLATWERIGDPEFIKTTDGGTKCVLRLKGKIYSKGSPDPAYEIRIDGKDRSLGLDKSLYYSGDEVQLSFWITKDSYITVLCVDEDQNVYLIYPNKFASSSSFKAGEIFEIPGELAINLKAILPKERSETLELMHIIATKKSPLFLVEETREISNGELKYFSLGQLKNVSQRLAKLNRSDWTMMVLPYSIKAR